MDDEVNRIVSEAEYVLAIVGDVGTGKFSLVSPSLAGIEDFLGVVAIVKGRLDCAFMCGIPQPMLDAIRREFYGRIEAGFRLLERVQNMPVN